MELWLTPRSRSVARWPTPSRYCAKAAAFFSGATKRRSFSPNVLWQAGQRQRWWPWREVPFLTQWVVWQWGQFMPNPTTLQPAYQYLFSNPKDWFGWISRSRLKPMINVAQMLKRHLENLLTYLKHHITNAVTEGLNSKIQSIKSAARGFRNFKNYRTRILFFCGKLDLYPL
jgi:Transposase